MTPSQLIAFCERSGVTLAQLRDTKRHAVARKVRKELFDKLAAEGMNGRQIERLVGLKTNSASCALRRSRRRNERDAEAPRPPPPPSKLDARIADILPPEKHVRLLLVADPHPERLYQRRRGDCAREWSCVDEWIEVHGSEQAACPKACPMFTPIPEAV